MRDALRQLWGVCVDEEVGRGTGSFYAVQDQALNIHAVLMRRDVERSSHWHGSPYTPEKILLDS